MRIELADTGPGIKDEDKSRVFDPYFTKNRDGMGLGLAIVNSIILELGGRINATDNIAERDADGHGDPRLRGIGRGPLGPGPCATALFVRLREMCYNIDREDYEHQQEGLSRLLDRGQV